MMYSIKRAVGISEVFGGRYLPIVVTDVPVYKLFIDYESVIIELKHRSSDDVCHINADDLPPEIKASRLTLPQCLTLDPSAALPTTPGPISNRYGYLHFYDAWCHGFSIEKLYRAYHPDMEVAEELKIDLHLTKEGAHYWNMGKYCLYTVNGLLHPGDANSDGVMIFHGAESGMIASENQVGILDFQHLGEITTIPITDEMVSSRGGALLRSAVYIKLPQALNGKIPMLSIGGYLHALDGSYSLVADNLIRFDFANYSWETRYLEMRDNINVESLEGVYLGDSRLDMEMLWEGKTIRSLFALPQSFIILVDSDNLQRSDIQLEESKLPGVYITPGKAIYPLVLGNGRMAEYRGEHQHGLHVMNVNGYLVDNSIRETTGFRADPNSTTQLLPDAPRKLASGKQLMISKILKE